MMAPGNARMDTLEKQCSTMQSVDDLGTWNNREVIAVATSDAEIEDKPFDAVMLFGPEISETKVNAATASAIGNGCVYIVAQTETEIDQCCIDNLRFSASIDTCRCSPVVRRAVWRTKISRFRPRC